MEKVLSPSRTSFYLVLKLIEMNCRCRQGKGKNCTFCYHLRRHEADPNLEGIHELTRELKGK